MIVPVTYYVVIAYWIPRNRLERCQYLVGLAIFVTCGPFINISVSLYAIFYMDNFSWGKTRQVIAEPGEGEEGADAAVATGEKEKMVEPPAPGLPVELDNTAANTAAMASGHRRSCVPDLENQLDQIHQPYIAPAGLRVGSVSSAHSYAHPARLPDRQEREKRDDPDGLRPKLPDIRQWRSDG